MPSRVYWEIKSDVPSLCLLTWHNSGCVPNSKSMILRIVAKIGCHAGNFRLKWYPTNEGIMRPYMYVYGENDAPSIPLLRNCVICNNWFIERDVIVDFYRNVGLHTNSLSDHTTYCCFRYSRCPLSMSVGRSWYIRFKYISGQDDYIWSPYTWGYNITYSVTISKTLLLNDGSHTNGSYHNNSLNILVSLFPTLSFILGRKWRWDSASKAGKNQYKDKKMRQCKMVINAEVYIGYEIGGEL